MKTLRTLAFSTLAALLLFAGVPSFGQYAPSAGSNLSRVAGRFMAANYNYPSTNNYVINGNSATGTGSITVQTSQIQLPDGRQIYPYNIFSPILVGAGTNQELVTPTGVSNCYYNTSVGGGTCQITASFSNTHSNGDPVQSGTAGAAEAQYDAFLSGGGLVVLDTGWMNGVNTSCTGCYASGNAALTAMVPLPTVAFEDDRAAAVRYWKVTAAATSLLAAPTPALTAQAACDATHTFCSDATVAGSASWGSTIYGCITYVDINGNESPCSATASFTSVASKAIDIGAPAAVTNNVVGWKPYLSLSGGSYAAAYSVPLLTQPTTLLAVPLSSGVCTLTTLETVTPACAIGNATYGQAASTTGAGGLFSAGGAQFTGYPVVTNTLAPEIGSASTSQYNPNEEAHATYKYAPSPSLVGEVQTSHIIFPIAAAAQTTVAEVAGTIPLPANFMNYAGRTVRICGFLTKTSTTADTITAVQFWWDAEGSNVTAGTPVQLNNIQITATLTAAPSLSFCGDLITTVASTSATGGTITPGFGWLVESQVAAGTIHFAAANSLFAAVGSLNLALPAHISIIYNHTTGTDGSGVTLSNVTVNVL